MTVATRLAAFGVVLALAFLAAFGLGRTVGPVGPAGTPEDEHGSNHSAATTGVRP